MAWHPQPSHSKQPPLAPAYAAHSLRPHLPPARPFPLASIADLIRKNPSAATAGPGTALSDLPCYSAGNDININYYGGDVAFGMVSGNRSASAIGGWAGKNTRHSCSNLH